MTAFLPALAGLFSWDHMKYEFHREKRANQKNEEPSLAEMTKAAINVLKKSDNGFFLMVEGGKIDMAHHDAMVRSLRGHSVSVGSV